LRFVRFLLGCLLAAALLWWLFKGINLHAFLAELQAQARALPLMLWLLAPVGLFASYGLRAARVRSELNPVRPVSWASAWQVTLVHNAAVNLLPLRSGEFAYPYLVHKKLGIAPAESVASLLWMRFQDLVVLITLGLVLFLPLPHVLPAGAAIVFVAFVGWIISRLRSWLPAHPPVNRAHADPVSWRQKLRHLTLPVLRALADGPRHSRASWLYSIANWCLKLIVIASVLQAAAGLPLWAGLHGALGGELAALLPVQGPSGLGTYEAGVWGGVASGQKPPPTLPIAALLVHGIIFATALLAGGVAGLLMWLTHNVTPEPGSNHSSKK
jgi:uncharacterized membrane protein YbhN (UPF0104 family)